MNIDQILKTVPSIIFFYIKTVVFPKDLTLTHVWIIKDISIADFFFPPFVDMLLVASIIYLGFACRKRGNTFFTPYIFFTIWFTVSMIFHLNLFLSLDMTAAERWFYVPFVGLLGLLGLALRLMPAWWKRYRVLLVVLSMIIVSSLAVRTSIRLQDWKDPYTLYTHDLQVAESFISENAFGNWLLRHGKKDEAQKHLRKSKRMLDTWKKQNKNLTD